MRDEVTGEMRRDNAQGATQRLFGGDDDWVDLGNQGGGGGGGGRGMSGWEAAYGGRHRQFLEEGGRAYYDGE